MKKSIFYLVSFLTGAVISVMVVANTELGRITTNEVSLIVNQAIGVVLTTFILLAGRKSEIINPARKKSRWYMYFGGLFGICVMVCNFYSILNVGSALAMAAAVFGQSLTGLVTDLFGLFSMPKRKQSTLKWISLALSFTGIFIMSLSQSGSFRLIYILMGVLAGIMTMLQMTYNSSFAKAKGAVFSARQNAISGLAGTIIYAALLMPEETLHGFTLLPSASFLSIITGGTLAIVVVVSTNLVIPRIPAVYSALLLSCGQILTSIVIDTFLYDLFSPSLLIGSLVMLAGIGLNFSADRKA